MNKILSILSLYKTEKGWVLLDQVVFSATSFITTILLARQLGIEQFGQYSSVVLFLYLLMSISNALVVAPFQVLVAKQDNRKGYIAAIFIMQFVVIAILSFITFFIFQINIPIIKSLRGEVWGIIFLLAGFLLQDFFRRIFLATQKAKKAFIIDILSGAVQIIWLGAIAFKGNLNLSYALFIIAATYIPALVFAFLSEGNLTTNFKDIKKYTLLNIINGKWLLLTSFLQWWANNFLVAASGIFLGTKALGALRLAQTIFGVMNALLQVLENYALPAASVIVTESSQKLKIYLLRITKKSFLFLLPVVVCCIVFAKQIFFLCGGADYIEYAYALQGMSILYLIIFTGYPIRIAIRVFLLNREFFFAYCISFLFSLLSAKYLIQQWQLTGVIISLIINQLLMLGYWQMALSRKKFVLWK